jgi:mono/diheme cytochrome c family protein
MNYPVWELQASGLLIAIVAILHVFVSHFAVGGGLFLVLTEHKARRDGDAALLAYLERHSRFFILLTLVFGAITGVGIWFTITLVHPSATSSLISTFVWGWAIEWAFFATEIAAALVYYYGWRRLSPRMHLAVGWVYLVSAWFSLVVINGILTYMLTPGEWVTTRGFWDAFFNPTYWPALWARTAGAIGLAGLYALFTATFLADDRLKARIARYAGLRWVVPAAVLLPLTLAWYFNAAQAAGVPLDQILGTSRTGAMAALEAAWRGAADTGYPFAQHAARVGLLAMLAALLLTLFVVFVRGERYGRISATALLVCGLLSIGGAEWMREGIRKPFVLGSFMFVNGVRVPPPAAVPAPPVAMGADAYTVAALNVSGVLPAARWARLPANVADAWHADANAAPAEIQAAVGREIFRLQCGACHSLASYNAIAPLVEGRSAGAIEGVLARLAGPAHGAGWDTPGVAVDTWRGRRMPPFVGTKAEARAVAVYLAQVGGGATDAPAGDTALGAQVFEQHCSMCHGPDAGWPIASRIRGRRTSEIHEVIGRLPSVNPMMPAFPGSDEERRALAEYLAALDPAADSEVQR